MADPANITLSNGAVAWLIERYIHNRIHYWSAGGGGHGRSDGFSDRYEDAVRFSRFEDAAVVLSRLCEGYGRVAQHAWIDGVRCEHKNRGYRVPSHVECLDCGATYGWE